MKLEFEYKPFAELKNAFEGDAYLRLKNNIISLMMNQKDEVFRSQASPDGVPWKKLSDTHFGRRDKKNSSDRKGKVAILEDTGTLRNSIAAQGQGAPGNEHTLKSVTGDEASLGTNVVYGPAQNYGATIIAGERSKIGDQRILHATKIVIPARPFMGISERDEEEIVQVIEHQLNAMAAT